LKGVGKERKILVVFCQRKGKKRGKKSKEKKQRRRPGGEKKTKKPWVMGIKGGTAFGKKDSSQGWGVGRDTGDGTLGPLI